MILSPPPGADGVRLTNETAAELPHRTGLSGHDAYCHVCWDDIYLLWVSPEPPDHDVCPFGAAKAHECPNACGRARQTATLRAALSTPPKENDQ